jgi:hypothetical protein
MTQLAQFLWKSVIACSAPTFPLAARRSWNAGVAVRCTRIRRRYRESSIEEEEAEEQRGKERRRRRRGRMEREGRLRSHDLWGSCEMQLKCGSSLQTRYARVCVVTGQRV